MEKLNINALVIGKSGSGKSSLLNYLCGREVEKTGSGRPVTEKGIFEHTIELNNKCWLNIFDTWGLEPDKTGEWQKMIDAEIKKHDVEDIKDWFHFILYCINAQSTRIEDFEEEFITSLLNMNNHVIVVFTHCDNSYREDLDNMISYLTQKNVIDKKNIIEVCSVEKTLIGGRKVHSFGKERLLERIQENFWHSICDKVPERIRNKAIALIDEVTLRLKNYADKSIQFFNIHSDRNYKKLNSYCNEQYNQCINEIVKFSEEKINESIDFYLQICNMFYLYMPDKSGRIKDKIVSEINYSMDFSDKFAENIAFMIVSCIPIVNCLMPKLVTEMKQEEYKEYIDNASRDLIKKSNNMCDELSEYLRNLYIKSC